MAMKFFGAEMEGVTQLENRIADPPQFIGSRDDGRMFFNSTAQAIKFGAGGIFKTLDIPTGTIMLFGQSSAPAGWTKKTDWQNNSMLVFTNEDNLSSGGDSDATAGTQIQILSSGSHSHTVDSHTHVIDGHSLQLSEIPSHTHTAINVGAPGGVYGNWYYGDLGASGPFQSTNRVEYTGGGNTHTHGGGLTGSSSPATSSDGSHVHSISSQTPYYQTVIAATKD